VPSTHPSDWSITHALAQLRERTISHEEYLEATLEQLPIAERLGAVIHIEPEAMLEQARRLDAHGAAGAGALRGIPIGLKDNIDTVDAPTSGGTPALADHRPSEDAEVVARLRRQGAIIGAKCNMHELSFGPTSNNAFTGPVLNPFDPSRTAGGSSGGSAVAVAVGLHPGTIGADTGGSSRVPAAFCGVIGLRPTLGRYPSEGMIPISPNRDTAGPMARTVADILLLDAALAGAPLTPVAEPQPAELRIGLPRAGFLEGLAGPVDDAFWQSVEALRRAGVEFVDIDIDESVRLANQAGDVIAQYEFTEALGAYLRASGSPLTVPEVLAEVASPDVQGAVGMSVARHEAGPDVYHEAMRRRDTARDLYHRVLQDAGVQLMLHPSSPVSPQRYDLEVVEFAGRSLSAFHAYTWHGNFGGVLGFPAISLPAGRASDGMPFGIELAAAASDDARLLAAAATLERLLPAPTAPTDLPVADAAN